MLTAKTSLCLDFGAGNLKGAEFETNPSGGITLKKFGLRALGADGLQDSKREKALLAAAREILGAEKIDTRHASLCAPGFQVFSKVVKLPPVDAAKVKQIVHYEAVQNIPYPLEEAVWDFQILGANAAGDMEVLLVAIKADAVESYFRTADAAGLNLQLVDAPPAALCNAFRFNYGDLEGCSLLLDIGAKTSNVLLFENGKFFARSLNIGANAITQDFIAETKLSFAKAEALKVNEGVVGLGGAYADPEHPHQAAMAKIARQVFTRLHIQVNQTIQHFRGQQGGAAPVRVFLAGQGASMPYTTEFFAEKLGLPVEYFNPFRNVLIDPTVDADALSKVGHGFGAVVGLALRQLARCPVELNLIPKTIRSRQKFDARKPYFIAAMASLVAVVFATGFFFQKTTAIKREALAELKTKLVPLQKRAEEMDRQEKLLANHRAEANAYTGYLRDRFFWPETLVEMRNLLVRVEKNLGRDGQDVGVWIENLGTVAPEDDEPGEAPEQTGARGVGPLNIPQYLIDNQEMFQRYFPIQYEMYKRLGLLDKIPSNLVMAQNGGAGAANTNLVTINVRFKAVNRSTPANPSANGALAFAVAEEFKKSGIFDAAGTKLNGDLEEPEMMSATAGTFRFGMTLKLKNEMQL
jgi:type IV pilus assembly protein PilM